MAKKINLDKLFKLEDKTQKICRRYPDKTACKLAVNETLRNFLKDKKVNYLKSGELKKPFAKDVPLNPEIIQRAVKKSLNQCSRRYKVPAVQTRFNKKIALAHGSCEEGVLNFADELERESFNLK